MMVVLLAFYSEAFCVSSLLEDMIDLLDDCVGCHSEVLVHLV